MDIIFYFLNLLICLGSLDFMYHFACFIEFLNLPVSKLLLIIDCALVTKYCVSHRHWCIPSCSQRPFYQVSVQGVEFRHLTLKSPGLLWYSTIFLCSFHLLRYFLPSGQTSNANCAWKSPQKKSTLEYSLSCDYHLVLV